VFVDVACTPEEFVPFAGWFAVVRTPCHQMATQRHPFQRPVNGPRLIVEPAGTRKDPEFSNKSMPPTDTCVPVVPST